MCTRSPGRARVMGRRWGCLPQGRQPLRQVWAQGGQLFPEEVSDEVWVRATAVMHRSASPFAGMAERLAQLKGDLRGGLARQCLGGFICDDKAAVAAVWRQASGQAGCQAGAAHIPWMPCGASGIRRQRSATGTR
ncbi:hypothetical protein BS642_04565 [Chromobacterium violaceum]|nr:hypothetical protein BS642_04565 [Chromobacterium violaceum]